MPKKMKPGKLKGPSHKRGGILLEAEGGEYIIKKSSVKKIGKAKLDKINKEGKIPMAKEGGFLKGIAAGFKKRKAKRKAKQAQRGKAFSKERRIAKLGDKGVKVTTSAVKDKSELSSKGRIRKGAKSVKVTKGGAYAAYDKKSKAAGSFRSSFAAARKAGKKTFTWDGRSYSTAVAKPAAKKAAPKPAAKKSRLEETKLKRMAARENRSAKKAAAVPATNPRLKATKEAREKRASKRAMKKKIMAGDKNVDIRDILKTNKAKGGMVGDSIKTYSNGGYVEGK